MTEMERHQQLERLRPVTIHSIPHDGYSDITKEDGEDFDEDYDDKPKKKKTAKGRGKHRAVKPAGHYVTNFYNARITNFNAADIRSRQRTLDDLPTTADTRATPGTPQIS
eukprot:1588639-Amphidinium_carterae.1